MASQYECEICGVVKHTEAEMRSHVAHFMESNEQRSDEHPAHPHWSDLEVSHYDLSAWEREIPGVTDY